MPWIRRVVARVWTVLTFPVWLVIGLILAVGMTDPDEHDHETH